MVMPKKIKSAAELRKKVASYNRKCEKDGKKVSITGLQLHLGISKPTYAKYLNGGGKIGEILEMERLRVEDAYINDVLTNRIVAGPIFLLKTVFGYREVQEMDHKGDMNITFRWKTDDDGDSNPV